MKYPEIRTPTALVTGCSSGIGLATARHLRDRGWRVVPTARKPEDLERLRAEGFEPVALDVADGESVRTAAAKTLDITGGVLGALVNNAGFGQPGALEDLSRDDLRMQFEVNVIGLQDLTNRFIPVFCRQGWGRIVNVSSVAGRLPLPLIGAYCASKHALEAMSDCLRIELRGSGVAVSIIEPGVVDTGIFDKASHAMLQLLSAAAESRFAAFYRRAADPGYRAKPRRRLMTRPDVVAGVIRHALESARPRRRYPVTAPARILPVLRRIAPDALLDRLMYARLRKAGEP